MYTRPFIAGIDPGVNTGLAIWNMNERKFKIVETCGVIQAFNTLLPYIHSGSLSEIVVEDARRRTWFNEPRNSKERIKKLQGAGSVKRDCSIWQEFCEFHKILFDPEHPKDVYAGFPLPPGMNKWDAKFFKKATGWTGRTSQHARDAAALVWNIH